MTNVVSKIQQIEQNLITFYGLKFRNADQEYIHNKKMRLEIENFIVEIAMSDTLSENDKAHFKRCALMLLAKNTGCAEDDVLSEEILDRLHESNAVTQEELNYYYSNVATNRWY